ncbi:serine/threonine-protein kinase BLUS1-like [Corylus avellana]|uniref:serine/threonine-protein kinase BLUS1-like n=1 Tax=Corylus avellana TaxID=13451 RepID=UPI00286A84F3|nr:serine/threonine-protein kinase BLUS1-like [Corylus avellana]
MWVTYQEEPTEVQYPLDSSNSYEILDEIGNGVSSVVYKAKCFAMDSTVVAIKAVYLDRSWWWQPKEKLLSHPNILNAHCTLLVNQLLWVVMPFMSAGSLQSIISSSFPHGLSEPCIAIILKETLSALSYLHKEGEFHKGIKPSNILIDSNGSVKLTDHFGMSSSSNAAATPYWMAPELLNSQIGYGVKVDIWAFGITALELAYGRPPLSNGPKNEKHEQFSKAFKDMVASCLNQDPPKRPSAEALLNHSFFENCGGSDFLVENVLQGLPSVEERFNESKNGDGDDEGGDSSARQSVKETRTISGWSFNEERFELDPVFQTESTDDSVVKQVKRLFGDDGETVIIEDKTGRKTPWKCKWQRLN